MGMGDIDPFGTDTIAKHLQDNQAGNVQFVQAIAKNIYSVTDFYTYSFPPNTHGLNTESTGLSPTVAAGFTSDRTRADIRRAQKRFVGIAENDVGEGGVFTDTAKLAWQALGDAMADINVVPVDTSSVTFTPYVFGREKYTTPEDTEAYRYYATESAQLSHIARINQWNFKPQTRTQTSRQYGRGS